MKNLLLNPLLLTFIATIMFCACTENQRARNFGGTEEIELPENTKVIGATWKETELWILMEDTITHVVTLKEKSSYGMVEGKVVFKQKETNIESSVKQIY